MSLPGVKIIVQNGNLNLQPGSAESTMIYLGAATNGTVDAGGSNTGTPVSKGLKLYGSVTAMTADLDIGEVVEAAAYAIDVSGGPCGVLPILPTAAGALSSVTHIGSGASNMTVTAEPHKSILATCVTTGVLNNAFFTFSIGGGVASAPVGSGGGWASTGFLVPGTYTTMIFPAHTYTAGETYTVDTLGTVTYAANGSGGSSAAVTQTSWPVDEFTPLVAITKGGALATAQFTYSIDGTSANTSAPILTTSGGTYAIPGTGIKITLAGTLVVGDTFSFGSIGPTWSNSDLTTAMTSLETTFLSTPYSMATVVGNLSSAANWNTQCATLEIAALALFNLGVFMRFFNGAPTVGTIAAPSGTYTVDSADTDAVLLTSRLTVSAPHVAAAAGDCLLNSPLSGLALRRNASWIASARAASINAARDIGDVSLGAVPGVISLYRNEQTTPALDAVGFVTLRTFPGSVAAGTGLPGFYITGGHTMDVVTSDYYPLTNARVVDKGCGIVLAALLPYVNGEVPTTTRNGLVGVITNRKALQIEGVVNGDLSSELVNTVPQDAVAALCAIDRTNNVLSTSTLIANVAIQPFAYSKFITINIGMALSA